MKTSYLFLMLGLLSFISCDDILEEDISNDIVQTTYPSEGDVIESNVVTFQWNELDGADDYRVQIYDLYQIKIYDTLVSAVNVSLPMAEGGYQWRVRGENSAYESTYSFPVYFEVNESFDLTDQQVILSSPVTNFVTNSTTFTLAWDELPVADYYKLEIVNNSTGGTIVYQQDNITTTSVTLNNTIISQDGSYTWKVKAINSISETSTYTSRTFSIDTVNPNQPQNSLPANSSTQTVNQTISFSWTIPADSGTIQSAISYVIEIASDSAFTNILQSSNVSGTTFSQSFTSTGDYYWRVTAKDAAGNTGTPSSYFTFTVN
ncbi:hypothetical protein NHF50_00140 [Flavobacterium sp. NRK F10]|uniref:hypothetical protein n=1 Tax=Flavobacterium sp. NRK F10 TaxID=2954931 RepID=UPI002091CD8E|nr:hypothetical protein [Flavobacterium sp. NRK F10]MCO6173444.1 hypothetical protein [Flavobacterium sp. NRK F10]